MPPTFTARDCIKAARSAGQNACVRIGRKNGWTAIWDDKLATPDTDWAAALPLNQMLILPDEQFDTFQDALRAGNTNGTCVQIDRSPSGQYMFTSRCTAETYSPQVVLHFDPDEYEAFMDGVRKREFEIGRFATASGSVGS